MVTEDFKRIIDSDILICEKATKTTDHRFLRETHTNILSKYGKIIDGFDNGLLDIFYDNTDEYKRRNLETMRQKLLLFKAMEYENKYSSQKGNNVVVHNTNQIDATFSITFKEAKQRIEAMTSLTDNEIEEIKSKIDELNRIVNSSDRKSKKWENAKSIIKWVADKGVDVGITMLPLLMKID